MRKARDPLQEAVAIVTMARSMRAPVQREHSFQAWVDRFIDRVVLPPMFTSAIDVAARDMANVGRRSALAARGVKFGIPDLFVCQHPDRIVWLELKRGTKATSNQIGVHKAMRDAGQCVYLCNTMYDVLDALRLVRFALHGNADGLAAEYDERVVSKERAPRTPKAPRAAPRVRYGRRAA